MKTAFFATALALALGACANPARKPPQADWAATGVNIRELEKPLSRIEQLSREIDQEAARMEGSKR